MQKPEIKYKIALFITGCTIYYGILGLILLNNYKLFDQICYHYSDGFLFYFLYFIVPAIMGFFIQNDLSKRSTLVDLKNIILIVGTIQILLFIFIIVVNFIYWGYFFKRPSSFSEISSADKIVSCQFVYSSADELVIAPDSAQVIGELYGRRNFYEGEGDRLFMEFQDNSGQHGDLYDYEKVIGDPNKKLKKDVLRQVAFKIFKSGVVIRKHNACYLTGYLTEFVSSEKEKYLFAGLHSLPTSNDHHPFYEFLFKEHNGEYKPIKDQRFFYDVAEFEGLEFWFVFPYLSMWITVIFFVTALIIFVINKAI